MLLDGLKRLEYRGYDSAGIATISGDGIDRRRAEGKLVELENVLDDAPLDGEVGIGHTRWATHGAPTTSNAHPHASARVAVVHNGIIENFQVLRQELSARGHVFETDTDTEAIVHLITDYLDDGMTPAVATAAALKRLEGAFALGILFSGEESLVIGARRGSPLAIGYGKGEMFMGSDALALAPLTSKISYLDEGDWVELSHDGAIVHDAIDQVVERPAQSTSLSGAAIGKGNYRHFMLKEIYEQPAVIGDTLTTMYDPVSGAIR